MHMAFVFGMNQFISHGFGIFLFASLAPLMREEIAFTNWHIAAIGALSQLAYLGGAMLISTLGNASGPPGWQCSPPVTSPSCCSPFRYCLTRY
ncbi:hypothetical protein [Aliamphritea spongicola]|nr:hypothetical protein [Aliamphritea spongicola]